MNYLIQLPQRKMKLLLTLFGFCSLRSFTCSLLRIDSAQVIGFFSLIATVLSEWLGLKVFSLIILFVLLAVELGTGLWAGYRTFGSLKARKLERFGLKVFVYFLILLVLNTFTRQYNEGSVQFYAYSSLHSFMVFYVIGVYTVSVLEKIHILTGRTSPELNTLINLFKFKIKQAIGKVKEDKENE